MSKLRVKRVFSSPTEAWHIPITKSYITTLDRLIDKLSTTPMSLKELLLDAYTRHQRFVDFKHPNYTLLHIDEKPEDFAEFSETGNLPCVVHAVMVDLTGRPTWWRDPPFTKEEVIAEARLVRAAWITSLDKANIKEDVS